METQVKTIWKTADGKTFTDYQEAATYEVEVFCRGLLKKETGVLTMKRIFELMAAHPTAFQKMFTKLAAAAPKDTVETRALDL